MEDVLEIFFLPVDSVERIHKRIIVGETEVFIENKFYVIKKITFVNNNVLYIYTENEHEIIRLFNNKHRGFDPFCVLTIHKINETTHYVCPDIKFKHLIATVDQIELFVTNLFEKNYMFFDINIVKFIIVPFIE